jgi:glyoxylase-like metal-dependent hydrolase (beta-lactamase superfamily II)
MTTALPDWCTLVRADNPGPMTLDGTNTYVLRADGGVVVVDPGPLDEQHLQAVAEHGPVVLTLLTHGHPDHAEGAARFAEITAAPVLARDPALCIRRKEALDEDGRLIGTSGLSMRVLHTPGHTGDSVSFVVSPDAGTGATGATGATAVLTGDTLLGRGTTVVAHPDGRLGDYLASLHRLAELGAVTCLPGHGPVRDDAGGLARDYLAHRAQRLEQVRTAVADGAVTPADVVRRVYADVDPALWPAAELSVRAQLEYLDEQQS